MFNKAIVRKPCKNLVNGITNAQLGKPDYDLALDQHAKYVETLVDKKLEVITLEEDDRFPDSVFVEDTAVVTKDFAIITQPEPSSRKEEVKKIRGTLEDLYNKVDFIDAPGSMEGGDVMQIGTHFFVGLTKRTNQQGAKQFDAIVKKYGYSSSVVPVVNLLHLKTGCSYLGNNNLLVVKELSDQSSFAGYNKILVDEDEKYAANSLWINGTVLVPAGYPKTKAKIEQAGYDVITLEMSEFRKLDGGLSCLSLRI